MGSRSLQSILIISFMMGLIAAFIGTMVIFTLQEFDVAMLFKIIFMSQVASTILTFFVRVQNCLQPRQWQMRMADSIESAFNPFLRVMGVSPESLN